MIEPIRDERDALAFALAMLGFDPERLAAQLQDTSPDSYWARLALAGSRVSFDHALVCAAEPGLSPVAVAAVQSWWLDARLGELRSTAPFLPASKLSTGEFDRLRLTPARLKQILADSMQQPLGVGSATGIKG